MLQLQLIALYDYVCRHYATHPALHFQRQSNNYCPTFTDQELMTIYLFGLLKHRFSLRLTYDYIVEHWADWFPQLPSYQAVNYRLNQISWHFESLLDALSQHLQTRSDLLADVVLTDSVPIILSRQPASATVALGLADKGYCATKKLFYHGLKWHMLATDRLGRLPLPQRLHLRAASVNDLTALRVPVAALESVALVGEKAYASAPFAAELVSQQQVSFMDTGQKS
ncbi:IS982 family transposase [Spirosoma daeguense]